MSSKDSTKLSATAWGSVIFALISVLSGSFHIDLSGLSDNVDSAVIAIGQLLSAGYAIWGMWRKIHRTLGGRNEVINSLI